LLHEGRIALAMVQNDRGSQDELADLVAKYEQVYGPAKMIPGARVNYWFWTDQTTRLMICGLKKKDVLKITTALGDEVPCNALSISEEAAQRDQMKVDQLGVLPEPETTKK
jgi:hypothetical protein